MARDYYYDDDYDDEGGRRWLKLAAAALVVAGIAGGGFWLLTAEDEASSGGLGAVPTTDTAQTNDTVSTTVASTQRDDPRDTIDTIPNSTTTTSPPTTESTPDSPPTPPSSAPPVLTPLPPAPAGSDPGYPTGEDGAPLPIIVKFDTDVITLSGLVPSQAAKDRLEMLALANSKTKATVVNELIINENVPIGVGVRVIELNSVRFPEGSAEIRAAHAAELERVADVMKALPNVTVLVIGHADQRGDEERNYALSAERASAVVNWLHYLGVSPSRLSSRGVGEADLLTLNDDDAALTLNRRTEFIFYGLLTE